MYASASSGYACAGVWVCGMRVCGYTGIYVYGYTVVGMRVRVCMQVGMQVCMSAGMRVCGYAAMWVNAGMFVCGYEVMKVCGCRCVQLVAGWCRGDEGSRRRCRQGDTAEIQRRCREDM